MFKSGFVCDGQVELFKKDIEYIKTQLQNVSSTDTSPISLYEYFHISPIKVRKCKHTHKHDMRARTHTHPHTNLHTPPHHHHTHPDTHTHTHTCDSWSHCPVFMQMPHLLCCHALSLIT